MSLTKTFTTALIISAIATVSMSSVTFAQKREAIIKSLTGKVYIKKSGGKKEFLAVQKLSLNQGDRIRTTKNSYIVLEITDTGDELTLNENSELIISDLSKKTNKKQKHPLLSGSLYVSAKSLVNADDDFEIETPTAIMGIRGTQFMTSVDLKNDYTNTFVISGKVLSSLVNTDKKVNINSVIWPMYETHITKEHNVNQTIAPVNPERLAINLNPTMLEAIIRNYDRSLVENETYLKNDLQTFKNKGSIGDASRMLVQNEAQFKNVEKNVKSFPNMLAQLTIQRLQQTESQIAMNNDDHISLKKMLTQNAKTITKMTDKNEFQFTKTEQEQMQEREEILKNYINDKLAKEAMVRIKNADILESILEKNEQLLQENETIINQIRLPQVSPTPTPISIIKPIDISTDELDETIKTDTIDDTTNITIKPLTTPTATAIIKPVDDPIQIDTTENTTTDSISRATPTATPILIRTTATATPIPTFSTISTTKIPVLTTATPTATPTFSTILTTKIPVLTTATPTAIFSPISIIRVPILATSTPTPTPTPTPLIRTTTIIK